MAKKKPTRSAKKTLDVVLPESSKDLTPEHRLFITHYAGAGQDTFGHATHSYARAYGYSGKLSTKQYKVCQSSGSRLLSNAIIAAACNALLDSYIENTVVDRERAYVIMQRKNVVAKVMAIKSYDEVKGRLVHRVKLSGSLKSELNDKQMSQMADIVSKKLTVAKR